MMKAPLAALIVFLLLATLAAACAPVSQPTLSPTQPSAPPTQSKPVIAEPIEPTQAMEPAVPTENQIPLNEAEQAVAGARAFLATFLNISETEIKLVSQQEVEWPDGCLGLAGPDEMCTMAIVPGFRIVFEACGVEYVLHTNRTGSAVRLNPAP